MNFMGAAARPLAWTLAEAEGLAAGLHARSWNGRDEQGQALAAGVYFARLRGGGRSISRKLALLR